MADIDIWASGKPLPGFTVEDLTTNARKLFPNGTIPQLARFISGTRFKVTRVTSPEAADKAISALKRAGIDCEALEVMNEALDGITLSDVTQPPPSPPPTVAQPSQPPLAPVDKAPSRPFIPREKLGSYVRSTLTEGEQVEYVAHVSLLSMWFPAVLAVVSFVKAFSASGDTANLIFLGCCFLGYIYVVYTSTELAVSNKRVIAKTGILSRVTVELNLKRVETVQIQQDAIGHSLGYGTVVVSGAGNPQEKIHKIAFPLRFRRAVFEAQEAAGH